MYRLPRRHGFVLVLTLLLSACAGQATRTPAPATVVEGTQVVADVATDAPAQTQVDAITTDASTAAKPSAAVLPPISAPQPVVAFPAPTQASAEQAPPSAAEDDFNALYGHPEYDPVADPTLPPGVELPSSYDPWESFNRRMHDINNLIDRTVAKPLALLYMKAIPRPVRLGVSNFFNNLGQPVSAINALLQGRPRDAGWSLLRFTVNTTLGLGGLFDPATRMRVPYRDEDFGQTLAVWGWRQSRYLELPVFGPRTIRDAFGMLGDAPLSPLPHIGNAKTQAALRGLQLVDVRTRLFSVDSMRENVADEYALYRDAWLQRRNYQISSGIPGKRTETNGNLPDYLREEEDNPTVPVDVIPVRPSL